jgi:hypothetical protein
LGQFKEVLSDASQNAAEESSTADLLPRVKVFRRAELESWDMDVIVDDVAEDERVGSRLEADRNRQSVI